MSFVRRILVVSLAFVFAAKGLGAVVDAAGLPRLQVPGYEQVESVSANGAQYIDTGVVGCEGLTAEVVFCYTKNVTRSVLGATDASGSMTLPVPDSAAINRKYRVASTFSASAGTRTLFLFASNASGTAKNFASARIYSARLSVGERPVRDFVPCRETASGVYGFYERVEGRFYASQGTQPFFRPLRMGIYGGHGGTGSVFELYRLANRSPEVELVNFGPEQAQEGSIFSTLDMVSMPGGSSVNELASLGEAGQSNLVSYIRNGGLYYGTCAGSHLILEDELNISGYQRASYLDAQDMFDIALNEEGRRELGLDTEVWNMRYNRGPFITNGVPVAGADLRPWGVYTNTLQVSKTGNHLMDGKYAVLAGSYCQGRILVVASHPESNYQNFPFIRQSWRWLSGRDDITTETKSLTKYISGNPNIFYCSTYSHGIYPMVGTMLKTDDDPRVNLVSAGASSFNPDSKYFPQARAFICETGEDAADFHRGDYEATMNAFKDQGGLVLFQDDGLTDDDLWRIVDGIGNDARATTSLAWDADNTLTFEGSRTLRGLDVRISGSGDYMSTFSNGTTVFAPDDNHLGGDWVYCTTSGVHTVVVTNARVVAEHGNHRRNSFCTVSAKGGYVPIASNRFEITLGPRNIPGWSAVLTFEKGFTVAGDSSLSIDARGRPGGSYKILEANPLTILSTNLLETAVVQVDDRAQYRLFYEDNALVLALDTSECLVPVEYVESTGTQYIDTGIPMQDRIAVDLSYKWLSRNGDTNGYAGMFGAAWKPGDGKTYKCYLAYANSSRQWRCSLGTSAMTTLSGSAVRPTTNRVYDVSVSVDGTSVWQSVNGELPIETVFADTQPLETLSGTFYLGAVNKYGKPDSRWPSRIYSAKVYTNLTELVRDYRPCYIRSTKTYGLYDAVTSNFFPSAENDFQGPPPGQDSIPMAIIVR